MPSFCGFCGSELTFLRSVASTLPTFLPVRGGILLLRSHGMFYRDDHVCHPSRETLTCFLCSLCASYTFPCFPGPDRTSRVLLERNDEDRHPCLFLILGESTVFTLSAAYMCDVGCWFCVFCCLIRNFPSSPKVVCSLLSCIHAYLKHP